MAQEGPWSQRELSLSPVPVNPKAARCADLYSVHRRIPLAEGNGQVSVLLTHQPFSELLKLLPPLLPGGCSDHGPPDQEWLPGITPEYWPQQSQTASLLCLKSHSDWIPRDSGNFTIKHPHVSLFLWINGCPEHLWIWCTLTEASEINCCMLKCGKLLCDYLSLSIKYTTST